MHPASEGEVDLCIGPVEAELAGTLEEPGVAVGRAVQQHHGCAGGNVDARDGGRLPGQAEVGLHRALNAERLFNEGGDPLGVLTQLVLEFGVLAQVLQPDGEQAGGRLLAGGEQERGGPNDRSDVRRGAVGIGAQRQSGQCVLARFASTVLDVLGEPVVQPGQGVQADVRVAAQLAGISGQPESLAEALVVGFGDSEDIGDGEHGEGLAVRADELATTRADELVDLAVGQAPHERLVLLQALRREQAHHQRALLGVHRRVHGDHVLVHRELVAVAVDDPPDVVALEGDGKRGKRADHRVAGGERLGVEVDLHCLLVARDGNDTHVVGREDRAFPPQVVEVGIGVLVERLVAEEVDRLPVAQPGLPSPGRPRRGRAASLCTCTAYFGACLASALECDKLFG